MLIYVVSLFVIICVFIVHLLSLFGKVRIKVDKYIFMLACFGLAYALFLAKTIPHPAWDLSHHYALIDSMRGRDISFAFRYSTYKELYVINYLFFLVSRLPSNGYLVFITLSIEFAIYIYFVVNIIRSDKYITRDFKKQYVPRQALFLFFVYFSFVNFILAYSGIRNVLAVSVSAIALFRRYYQKKGGLLNWLFLIVACFIHQMAAIYIVVYLFARIKKFKLIYALAIVFVAVYAYLPKLLLLTNMDVFVLAADKMEYYNQHSTDNQYAWYIILVEAVLVISIFYYSRFENYHGTYNTMLSAYCIASMASLLIMRLVFARMIYILAYLALPDVYNVFSNEYVVENRQNIRGVQLIGFIDFGCIFIVLLNQVVFYITHFTGIA